MTPEPPAPERPPTRDHTSPRAPKGAPDPDHDDTSPPAPRPPSAPVAAGSTHSSAPDHGDLDPLAATARWTAAERARESVRPDALFTDPLADALAGAPGRELAERMRAGSPVDNPTFAVRTRFFDDAVLAAIGGCGRTAAPDQVVVLAAGMDARAFRLDLPAELAWYELDQPALLAVKERELGGAAPLCARHAVACDLTDDWPAALLGAGFDPARPTVWLIEGLLAYLDAAAVDLLLDRLTALSAPGSHLLCDPAGQSLIASPWMRPFLAALAAAGTPWRFGTDRPEDLLVPRGWRPTVALMADVATALGRWPFPQMPRDTPGVPQSFLVHARRPP